MKIKKKNVLLLCVLFLIVLAAGYVNYSLSNMDSSVTANAGDSDAVSADEAETGTDVNYFDQYRTEREATREKEISYIDAIAVSTEVDDQTKEEAQQQKLALVSYMEQELTAEGVIKTKLSMDAVVTVKDGSVNVVVAKKELTDNEVAQIADIIKSETGQSAQNIKIMPQT